MSDFIVQGNNYVSNSVSISRNIDEQIGVVSGNSSYSVLSNFISDNITCNYLQIEDCCFEYSDHNPVVMRFDLIP